MMLSANNDGRPEDTRIGRKMEMVSVLDQILKSLRIGRVDQQSASSLADYSLVFGVLHEKDGQSELRGQGQVVVDLCCDQIDRIVTGQQSSLVSTGLRRLVSANKHQLVKQLAGQLGVEYGFEHVCVGQEARQAEKEVKVAEYASNFIDNLLNECRDLIKPQNESETAKTRTVESFADHMIEGLFSSADLVVQLNEPEFPEDDQQQQQQHLGLFEEASSVLSSSWSADEKTSTQLRILMSQRTRADTETSSTSSVSTFASANTTLPAYPHGSSSSDNYVIRRHSAADVPVNNNLKRKLIMLLNSMDLSSRSKTSLVHKNRLSIDENATQSDPNAASSNCYCFNLNYSNKSLADASVVSSHQLDVPDDLCAQRRHSFENPFLNQATDVARPSQTSHHSSCLTNSEQVTLTASFSPSLTDSNNNSRKESDETNRSKVSCSPAPNSTVMSKEECLSVSCSSLPAAVSISVQKVKAHLPYPLKQYGKLSFKGLVTPGAKNRRQHTNKSSASSRSSRTSRRTRASHVEDYSTLGPLADACIDQLTDEIISEAAQTVLTIKQ